MKNDNNKYDIFLSYRRVGGFETAKHLFDLLVRDGYRVSFDIDTLRSGDFDIQLLHRIDQCTDFILILNAGAFDRSIDPASDRNKDWMRIELAYALEKKKNIIPIMLNGFTDFPDNLPDDIAAVERKNGPKYDSYYFDAFYHKLLRFLESEPIINTTTNKNDWDNSNDDSLLKIRTDLACRVLIDGEERATAHPDKITRIPLRGGSYQLQFVSLENEADKITIDTYRIERTLYRLPAPGETNSERKRRKSDPPGKRRRGTQKESTRRSRTRTETQGRNSCKKRECRDAELRRNPYLHTHIRYPIGRSITPRQPIREMGICLPFGENRYSLPIRPSVGLLGSGIRLHRPGEYPGQIRIHLHERGRDHPCHIQPCRGLFGRSRRRETPKREVGIYRCHRQRSHTADIRFRRKFLMRQGKSENRPARIVHRDA